MKKRERKKERGENDSRRKQDPISSEEVNYQPQAPTDLPPHSQPPEVVSTPT